MSWSDDMRCLYCDGRMPLYRKITHGQFCSGSHRKAYWNEQERLAVERLHQTHSNLQAYRPAVPLEYTPPPPPEDNLAPGGFIATILEPYLTRLPRLLAGEALPCESGLKISTPQAPTPQLRNGWTGPAGVVPGPRVVEIRPQTAAPRLSEILEQEVSVAPWWPTVSYSRPVYSLMEGRRLKFRSGVRVASPSRASGQVISILPLAASPRQPELKLGLLRPVALESLPEQTTMVEDVVPTCDRLFRLRRFDCCAAPSEVLRSELEALTGCVEIERRVRYTSVRYTSGPAAVKEEVPVCGLLFRLRPVNSCAAPLQVLRSELEALTRGVEIERSVRYAWAPATVQDEVPTCNHLFRLSPFTSCASPLQVLGGEVEALPGFLGIERSVRYNWTPATVQDEVPTCGHLFRLDRFNSCAVPSQPLRCEPEALTENLQMERSVRYAWAPPAAPVLGVAGLRPLEMQHTPLVQGTLIVERGVQVSEPAMELPVSIRPAQAELKLAHGHRYTVQFQGSVMHSADLEPAEFMVVPSDVAMPRSPAQPAEEAQSAMWSDFVPGLSGVVALPFGPEIPVQGAAAPKVVSLIPQPLEREALRPASKLEPIDWKPVTDAMQSQTGVFSAARLSERAARIHPWTQAVGFWKHAPRDLKMLIFAIPALLALAFHPALPKVPVAAAASTTQMKTEIGKNIGTAVNTQLATVRQAVFDRAAVALDEDFRAGLDDWGSRGDATTRWSFDATGFVQPGPLAVYKPTMSLTDYQMQFLGLIDEKALSWVVRAADFNNYYVVKIVVLKPGPLPTIGVTRYAVINGKAQDRVDTAVPMDARAGMLYRVTMAVHDDTFALDIQGQLVDSWTESRLTHGGVGFFTARGEKSRIRWVQVTHQYDMLGRLCAYLAPEEITTTNGSWNQ